MSGSDDNTIHIETDELEVTLRGDDEIVARAYGALRDVLVDSFESADELADTIERAPSGDTRPMHTAGDETVDETVSDEIDEQMSAAVRAVTPDGDVPEPGSFIQLVLRRSRYLKVHLLERREFADSFLGRSLDPTHLSRIYTDSRTEEQLGGRIDFGDTIWRELTPKGRAEVEGEGAFETEDDETEESDDE